MLVYSELRLMDFEAWAGGIETKRNIIKYGKVDEFNELIEEIYPDGLTATKLNDILWFDSDWIYESLGIEIEE